MHKNFVTTSSLITRRGLTMMLISIIKLENSEYKMTSQNLKFIYDFTQDLT